MLEYVLERMAELDRKLVLSRGGINLSGSEAIARTVIEAVKTRGDAALREFAEQFDGFKGGPLAVPKEEIEGSVGRVDAGVLEALRISKERIERFHGNQKLAAFEFEDDSGKYGQRVVPLDRVGVYVPGGTAAYMSSVLMACIPATLAGVREIAVCTPGKGGRVPAEILAAAHLCGVSEVHPIGGAQAIAALAYGTESIARVQKIVGPGGAFVSAAKLIVRNDCEIDFLAGPSEVLVIADGNADPGLIACDMLAQLEHDPLARAVLVSTSKEVLDEVSHKLEKLLKETKRTGIASQAARRGAILILAKDIEAAVEFSNEYAPEHLLIDVGDPMQLLGSIRSAGSVFLGRSSSVVFGDYCSGTNHILPTMGRASMRSSLSVYDFLKIIPYQSISEEGAVRLSKVVDILARTEGLPAHADSARARTERRVKR